ncbi:MAG: asparaginase [Phycisphaerales bacterium]|nr:asparaginase [Phycisphaerales bacterium]
MRRVTIITTGGTIEKTYDDRTGSLANRASILPRMLRRLRLEGTSVSLVELMSKDSLVMTDQDRARIVETVRACGGDSTSGGDDQLTGGIVITHGTDTLCVTGECLHRAFPSPRVPIVLTGAMRPYEMVRSDALQNLTEALFATATLPPGVYAVAHGSALRFPGLAKDRERGTFVRT